MRHAGEEAISGLAAAQSAEFRATFDVRGIESAGAAACEVRFGIRLYHTGTFPQTYGRILSVILHINGVPCCWSQTAAVVMVPVTTQTWCTS